MPAPSQFVNSASSAGRLPAREDSVWAIFHRLTPKRRMGLVGDRDRVRAGAGAGARPRPRSISSRVGREEN